MAEFHKLGHVDHCNRPNKKQQLITSRNPHALTSCCILNSSNAEIHCAKGRVSPAGGNQPGIHISPLGKMNGISVVPSGPQTY